MTLSKRLLALSLHYQHEQSVWDIGCDHGLLGSSFLQSPSVQEIHLIDPSRPVVDNLIKAYGSYISKPSFKIHIKHEFGQNTKLSSLTRCIFLAGMGGKEMEEIIMNLYPQMTEHDQLVISPHRNIIELREFLNKMDVRCAGESLVEDENRIYQMICLKTAHTFPVISLFGDELWQGPMGNKYREHQLNHFNRHQDPKSISYVEFLKSLGLAN